MFVFSAAAISLCGMLTAMSTNYAVMMIFQFGVGFGLGGVVIPFDAIAEFIPNKQRGEWYMANVVVHPLLIFSLAIFFINSSHSFPKFSTGPRLLLLGYFWTLGTMAVPILAWAGLEEQSSWRLFVFFCSMPCIFATLLAIVWVGDLSRKNVSHVASHHDLTEFYLPSGAGEPEVALKPRKPGEGFTNPPQRRHCQWS